MDDLVSNCDPIGERSRQDGISEPPDRVEADQAQASTDHPHRLLVEEEEEPANIFSPSELVAAPPSL